MNLMPFAPQNLKTHPSVSVTFASVTTKSALIWRMHSHNSLDPPSQPVLDLLSDGGVALGSALGILSAFPCCTPMFRELANREPARRGLSGVGDA